MPDEPTPPEVTEETEPAEKEPEKYTDEWYDSVEKRFKDLGDFIRSGRASHTHATAKPTRTATSAQASTGQSASDAASTDQGAALSLAADTRPPKPNHFWFRRLGGGD